MCICVHSWLKKFVVFNQCSLVTKKGEKMQKLRSYSFTIFAGIFISLFLAAAINSAIAADSSPAEKQKTENVQHAKKDTSLIDLFKTGGPLMYPLVLCSFAVISLIIYHIMELTKKKFVPDEQLENLKTLMYNRDTKGAFAYCEQNPNFLTNAFAAGVLRLKQDAPDKGVPFAEAAMNEAIDAQETKMNFWLNMISVIAAISPMIGLLGTVSGMIKAFQKIGLGGMGKPEQLAGNIGEALITTATGLIVGIPAMLAFFIFRGKFDALITNVTESLTELIDLYTGEHIARQVYEARSQISQPAAQQTQQVQPQQTVQPQAPPQQQQNQQNPE